MIKLRNLLKQPLNECVIARLNLDGNIILAKNRDRMYAPELEVIHELVNGVEVVYMHDILTDWSEGMNSNGIGIVNASLSVAFDEREGDIAKDKAKSGSSGKPSYDGFKIRTALSKAKLPQALRSVISSPKHSFVVEMTSKHLPSIKRISEAETITRTNHGTAYPGAGYASGVKRDSSISRQEIAYNTLIGISSEDEILDALSRQHSTDKFMNPYRRDNSYDIATSSQVLMNLTNLKFEFRHDASESVFKGFVNKLPKGYKPKIQVIINTTTNK